MLRSIILALALSMTFAGAAGAQQDGYFLGRWAGPTDWTGRDGDEAARFDGNGWWEFRSDGTFVDDAGTVGRWWSNGDRISFQYQGGGQSIYEGRLFNNVILGTMHNSDSSYTGIFSISR